MDKTDLKNYIKELVAELLSDDEDIEERLKQLGEYITDQFGIVSNIYNIKWQDDIGNAEELLDADGMKLIIPDEEPAPLKVIVLPVLE